VNLSGRQLEDPRLCDDVAHALAHAGLEPRHLTLEVTESVAMTNAATSLGRLERLREMGVHLAIDDFGTGYSSLAYLRRLPAHVLKIDRSFVRGLGIDAEDVQIARFLVDLARTLGLSTVAEGVETAEQLELLAALGCDVVQGFFLSPPLPAPQAMRAPVAWTAEARTPEAPPSEAVSVEPPRDRREPAHAFAAAPQPAA
jgi:EAL domain-containing protein (putative c-di-GMP-specific phosphodiesterase class I)